LQGEELTQKLFKEIAAMQEDLIQNQEREFRRLQQENRDNMEKLREETEEIYNAARRVSMGLTQFKQAILIFWN
jgi:hypothetical protein